VVPVWNKSNREHSFIGSEPQSVYDAALAAQMNSMLAQALGPGKAQVAVDVSSVIRASPDSFRIAWVERRYENDALAATERWTAIVTVAIETPHDADRLRKNPLGVFVHAINWSKELG